MDISDSIKDLRTLGHAYALEGTSGICDKLLSHLEGIGFSHQGHPDAFVRTYEHFGIDESREVARLASRKPLQALRSIVVIVTPVITAEAQNALLKTFEEPSAAITFFLITPIFETLLPTLRSRLQFITTDGEVEQAEGMISVNDFLSSTPASRIKLVEPLLKDRKPGEVIAFLSGLERALAPRVGESEETREGLRSIYRARRYGSDKGSLLKILVEQVALLTPRM